MNYVFVKRGHILPVIVGFFWLVVPSWSLAYDLEFESVAPYYADIGGGGQEIGIRYFNIFTDVGTAPTRIDIPIHDDFSGSTIDLDCASNGAYDTTVNVSLAGDSVTIGSDIFNWISIDTSTMNTACSLYTQYINTIDDGIYWDEYYLYTYDRPYEEYFGWIGDPIPARVYTGAAVLPETPEMSLLGTNTPAIIMQSVTNGVQTTGGDIWPLFTLPGIPLAFVIGRRVLGIIKVV